MIVVQFICGKAGKSFVNTCVSHGDTNLNAHLWIPRCYIFLTSVNPLWIYEENSKESSV